MDRIRISSTCNSRLPTVPIKREDARPPSAEVGVRSVVPQPAYVKGSEGGDSVSTSGRWIGVS